MAELSFFLLCKNFFYVVLLGIENKPTDIRFSPKTISFGISLTLLSIEYLLDTSISKLLNNAQFFPSDFWGITKDDLNNFENFCDKVSAIIKKLMIRKVDDRKQKLIELIYASNGALTVK